MATRLVGDTLAARPAADPLSQISPKQLLKVGNKFRTNTGTVFELVDRDPTTKDKNDKGEVIGFVTDVTINVDGNRLKGKIYESPRGISDLNNRKLFVIGNDKLSDTGFTPVDGGYRRSRRVKKRRASRRAKRRTRRSKS